MSPGAHVVGHVATGNNDRPLCAGNKVPGSTTFAAVLGFGVVVVRKVKALVCRQSGEAWIDPSTAKELGKS